VVAVNESKKMERTFVTAGYAETLDEFDSDEGDIGAPGDGR
jgi:hypothetical protein